MNGQQEPAKAFSNRWVIFGLVVFLILLIGTLLFPKLSLTLPSTPPSLDNTYTPQTQLPPTEIGSYDVLGHRVEPEQAQQLLQTSQGQAQLSPDNGAVAITQDLIDLGRKTFYIETFSNEYFNTDITGALDGPINPWSVTKAILSLQGQPTTNLQIPLTEDLTVGGRTFKAGSVLNTGLDVPAGSLFPLGLITKLEDGKIRTGLSCAACHATVDAETGKVLEGGVNTDLDMGLILAMASNSAAWFRHTGVNPNDMPKGDTPYLDAKGEEFYLPDPQVMEDAVDAALLDWSPGNFDSSPDIVENPAQIPPSYTHEAYPYGWNASASIGWFRGLTTLNNNVHGNNSDLTAAANSSQMLYGIDKDTYLGTMLQNAANPDFRLPVGANPSQFYPQIDPTPETPGLNEVVPMPGYPKGSLFVINGLMANSPGVPFAAQNNGMSAWQNTLAPPPNPKTADMGTLQRGARVFSEAGCVSCHSGRYFTNHRVIPEREIGTQPTRAKSFAAFPPTFVPPQTYPPNLTVPIPDNPPVLAVPTDIAPQEDIDLAFTQSDPAGGYKVVSLRGLHVTAPYLHDGGVAASTEAIEPDASGFYQVANPDQMGNAGTLAQGILPDPAASLRVLLDRRLRAAAVAANHSRPSLQRANIEGIGHSYWVDKEAGFTSQDQTDLIEFLLSLDDDPEVLVRDRAD